MRCRRNRAKSGFTLVEFAMVMLISGILMVGFLHLYKVQSARKGQDDTYARLFTSKSAVVQFYALPSQKRYPCPANPTLSIDNPNHGVEACPPVGTPIGDCVNGVCVVAGEDTAIDDDTLPDPVLVGMLPYRTMFRESEAYVSSILSDGDDSNDTQASDMQVILSAQAAYDGWSRQMTYQVSQTMTRGETFDKRGGAIKVVDEGDVESSRDGIHYALISHGENGLGAYTSAGQRYFDCPVGTKDEENCDLDGVVLKPIIRTFASGSNLLDDYVVYNVSIESEIWRSTSCEGGEAGDRSCISNTNSGFIGISTENPAQKLEIAGNIRTSEVWADEICNDENDCFPAARIGGDGMMCDQENPPLAANQIRVVREIRDSGVVCVEVNRPGTIAPGVCPAGEFIVGINSAGEIICDPMP